MFLGFRSQVASIYVYLLILLYNRKLQAQLAEVASVARLEHLLGVIAVDHNTTRIVVHGLANGYIPGYVPRYVSWYATIS